MSRPPAAEPPRTRILFVYDRTFSTFVERDWKIIQRAFPKSELYRSKGLLEFWRLRASVARADLIFCWFAGKNAAAAAFWNRGRKPLVVVAGGYDVSREPELHYGHFVHFPQAQVARWIFHRTDRVIAVSRFNAACAEQNAGVPTERIATLFHGFDPLEWPVSEAARDLDVATIAGASIKLKGLDLVAEAAAHLPDVNFRIIGPVTAKDLRRVVAKIPRNIEFTGPLYGDDLRAILARTRVYLQPSRHESFGCAVAEAMLTGCIPVVARSTAQPEVVGDAGFYAEPLTGAGVTEAVKEALAAPEGMRKVARERILHEYPLKRYAQNLIATLNDVLQIRSSGSRGVD